MKCKHYKGDGYTYQMYDGETIDLCKECELCLKEAIEEQHKLEDSLN